jgi:hypothetical protein
MGEYYKFENLHYIKFKQFIKICLKFSFKKDFVFWFAEYMKFLVNSKNEKMFGENFHRKVYKKFNSIRYKKQINFRKKLLKNNWAELILENGPIVENELKIHDGWAFYKGDKLPYLKEFVVFGKKFCEDRVDYVDPKFSGKSYLTRVSAKSDIIKHEILLKFALSSDLIQIMTDYLKCIPILTSIDFFRSDPVPELEVGMPSGSQLFHFDNEDTTMVRMVVMLSDVDENTGPFTFIPKSLSQTVVEKIGHGKPGAKLRVTDEEMFSIIPESSQMRGIGTEGNILMVDSAGCFHYGSRNVKKSRYVCMFTYSTGIQANSTDVTDTEANDMRELVKPGFNRLWKLVLDRSYLGE